MAPRFAEPALRREQPGKGHVGLDVIRICLQGALIVRGGFRDPVAERGKVSESGVGIGEVGLDAQRLLEVPAGFFRALGDAEAAELDAGLRVVRLQADGRFERRGGFTGSTGLQ